LLRNAVRLHQTRPRTRRAVTLLGKSAGITLAAGAAVALGIPIITDVELVSGGVSTPVFPDFVAFLAPGGDFEGTFIGGR